MRREVPSLPSARRGHESLDRLLLLVTLPPVGEDDEADGVADQAEDGEDGGQDPRDNPPAVIVLYTCYTCMYIQA